MDQAFEPLHTDSVSHLLSRRDLWVAIGDAARIKTASIRKRFLTLRRPWFDKLTLCPRYSMTSARIYVGFWIDHSRGQVLGATLTLETRYGTQLISAAAILVQIVGYVLWIILAFILHQYRARSSLREEHEAQLQVILRNCSGPLVVVWNVLKIQKPSQAGTITVRRSAVTIAASAALVYLGFLIAGVFVGQIASHYERPAVLLRPAACGHLQFPNTRDGLRSWNSIAVNTSEIAKQYARQCYSGLGTWGSSTSCSVYPVPNLKYKVLFDQPCPILDLGACYPKGHIGAPITLRTNPLDSHHDFGINARRDDRMTLEVEATCAPLSYSFVDTFISRSSTEDVGGSTDTDRMDYGVDRYMFGPLRPWGASSSSPETFSYAPIIREAGKGSVSYSMKALRSFAPHIGNWSNLYEWSPATPWDETDGDLSVFGLLPNGVTYSAHVIDPMFRTRNSTEQTASMMASYVPERDVYMLACSERKQICAVRDGKCTDWMGAFRLAEVDHWISVWNLTKQQAATLHLMASLSTSTMMFDAVNGVSDPLLASAYLFTNTESLALPNNQWQREVEGWFQLVLAKYQYYQTIFVDLPLDALGPGVKFVPAETLGLAMANLCKQQRIAAPQGYQNYNVFALALIASLGFLLPMVALVLKKWYHKLPWVDEKAYAGLTYRAEEFLQLHRMAMEATGWTPATAETPYVVLATHEDQGRSVLRYVLSENACKQGDSASEGSSKEAFPVVSKDI